MATIMLNKAILKNMERTASGNDPYLSDCIDVLKNSYSNKPRIANKLDFFVYIRSVIYDVLRYHQAQYELQPKKQGKQPSFEKPRVDEFALIFLYFVPAYNIEISSSSKTLCIYHYFGSREGTYDMDSELLGEYIYNIWTNMTVSDYHTYVNAIKYYASTISETNNKNIIVVNNGLYDKTTKLLSPFSPKYVSLTKIATDYNPNATLPIIHNDSDDTDWDVDSWIKDLAGANVNNYDFKTELLLWQIIAATINPSQANNKAIFFYSEEGNNGKGTFGLLLKNLVGRQNYSSLPIPAFKHEFMKELLIGKALNIADENPVGMYIDDVQDFKAYITGDDILINRKNKKPIYMNLKAVNIQMLNELPKTRDKSNSFYRRIILVPFLTSFTNNGERAYIKSDYVHRQDVLEYVLKKALEMDTFVEFVEPERSKLAMDDYKEENNSVVEFWNEFESDFKWDFLTTKFLYSLYRSWFDANYPKGVCFAKKQFSKQLKSYLTNDPNWEYRGDKQSSPSSIRINGRMDADEPLITEYHLIDFMNTTASGSANEKTKRDFVRPDRGRGVIRKPN